MVASPDANIHISENCCDVMGVDTFHIEWQDAVVDTVRIPVETDFAHGAEFFVGESGKFGFMFLYPIQSNVFKVINGRVQGDCTGYEGSSCFEFLGRL